MTRTARATTGIRLTRYIDRYEVTFPDLRPPVLGAASELDDALDVIARRAGLSRGYWLREGEYTAPYRRTWTWVQL